MLVFAVVAVSVFAVDGARTRLRTSQNAFRPHQATLVQQPAMFKVEIPKGPVEIHGLAGSSGSYPEENTADMEASPPSAQDSSHEDDDAMPLVSSTEGTGPEPPAEGTTKATDFSGQKEYDNDNDTDAGDASDWLQGTPPNQTEVLTRQDELELGVTPAPPADDANTQQVDLPFVVYPGYAKLEKEKLEKRKLAKLKKEQQMRATNQSVPSKQPQQIKPAPQQQVQSLQPVKSLTATGSSHMVKVAAGAKANTGAGQPVNAGAGQPVMVAGVLGKPVSQPGWGQPVGILRPKGWDMCLKFAKYTKDEGYKGVALVRVWKSTCEPGMLAGSATERFRLMCVSLGQAVEKFAVMDSYKEEDICDSILATFHDIGAVDLPFDR